MGLWLLEDETKRRLISAFLFEKQTNFITLKCYKELAKIAFFWYNNIIKEDGGT